MSLKLFQQSLSRKRSYSVSFYKILSDIAMLGKIKDMDDSSLHLQIAFFLYQSAIRSAKDTKSGSVYMG